MHRPNLTSLSGDDRKQLARLIQQYTTPAIVEEHWNAVLSGVHQDPVGFLSFHRNYIGGLEDFLLEQGYPQWVPLPAWNPVEPIPEEFNIPSSGPGRLQNLDPNVSFSPQFDPENLKNFSSLEELGEALMTRHNLVHREIGGVMNNLQNAPEAPIFWPFHAFIDDIWWDWQRITVVVPSCIGLSVFEARKLLNYCGLRTPIKQNEYAIQAWPRVQYQKPIPLTMSPRGTTVTFHY